MYKASMCILCIDLAYFWINNHNYLLKGMCDNPLIDGKLPATFEQIQINKLVRINIILMATKLMIYSNRTKNRPLHIDQVKKIYY